MASNDSGRAPIYFPGLDGLRFMAFLLVFFTHFSVNSSMPFWYQANYVGWTGVNLFFVLSAFLLTRLAVEETRRDGRVSIKRFYIRRVLRIWPLYYGYIIAYFVYLCIRHNMFPMLWARFLGLVTFTDNIWSAVTNSWNYSYFAHLWSLSMEEQFYFFLPLLIPLLVKVNKKTQLILGGTVLIFLLSLRVIAVALHQETPFVRALPISGDAFIIGILLGLGTFDQPLKRVHPIVKMLIGFALLYSLTFMPFIDEVRYAQIVAFPISAVSGGLMIDAIANHSNRILDVLYGNRVVRYLGKISFGLYVYHFSVTRIIDTHFAQWTGMENPTAVFYIKMALGFLITVLVSTASYELYEKHFLKLKKRFTVIASRPL